MICIGDIWSQEGKHSQAVELWRAARLLFEKSSQEQDVVRCDQRLAHAQFIDSFQNA